VPPTHEPHTRDWPLHSSVAPQGVAVVGAEKWDARAVAMLGVLAEEMTGPDLLHVGKKRRTPGAEGECRGGLRCSSNAPTHTPTRCPWSCRWSVRPHRPDGGQGHAVRPHLLPGLSQRRQSPHCGPLFLPAADAAQLGHRGRDAAGAVRRHWHHPHRQVRRRCERARPGSVMSRLPPGVVSFDVLDATGVSAVCCDTSHSHQGVV